jgi:glycosyltransferase involved in cell wall biosynthesis
MRNKIFYVPADDNTLIQLYTQAIALVVPSLYEGFGMSVLEAFSCGCPVALSSGGSLPEIGKDAAVYFGPTDADTLRTSLQRLLYDKNLRENLRNRGFERLSQFSWEKAAEQTKGIYKKFC